ncbi:MAG: hypothetical protein IPJ26_18095 [Bacteroidetes bacterium]|nr:hypothetical protein [Bacteroidota bacterium]
MKGPFPAFVTTSAFPLLPEKQLTSFVFKMATVGPPKLATAAVVLTVHPLASVAVTV